jgi:processive 1,2-diacylglycerol beta-glucosyltransferase
MAASDLLITKPGGLTVSEALAMNLPMLFYDSLPGQEEENAAYIESKGAAVWVKDLKQFNPTVSTLFRQPQKLNVMKDNAKGLRHPKAAATIAEILYHRYDSAKHDIASGI